MDIRIVGQERYNEVLYVWDDVSPFSSKAITHIGLYDPAKQKNSVSNGRSPGREGLRGNVTHLAFFVLFCYNKTEIETKKWPHGKIFVSCFMDSCSIKIG